ncbi:hypothetical protein N665_0007s0025 [Sinapis alba]|nr:hypothetical protein N665_0007s0025 [Sinapis alba]
MSKKLLSSLPSCNILVTRLKVEPSPENLRLLISLMSSTSCFVTISKMCLISILYVQSFGRGPLSFIFLNKSCSRRFVHSYEIIIVYILTSGFTPLR